MFKPHEFAEKIGVSAYSKFIASKPNLKKIFDPPAAEEGKVKKCKGQEGKKRVLKVRSKDFSPAYELNY